MKMYQPTRTITQFVRFRFMVSFLCVLCAAVVRTPAQEYKALADGVEYAELTREISGLKVNMNLLRLDLKKVRLDVQHAMDAAIGTEKTSSIATRHGAFAAINAGFFRLDTSIFAGDPSGLLIIDGKVMSDPANDRIAIGISNLRAGTKVEFGRSEWVGLVKIGKRTIEISGVDRQRGENEILYYGPEFHRTTLTTHDGIEVVVIRGRVSEINMGKGSSQIPIDGFVISASGTRVEDVRKAARIGMRVEFLRKVMVPRISHEPDSPIIEQFEDAVAGVPQLIKDGKIDITWEQEKASKSFVETRHPRTAVAKLKDGKFLMVTVDGRSESSGGIGLNDLAALLLEFGAAEAMNLDGGGSATMFLDGKVVNHPSDKEGERKVSDAILVTLRKKR